MKIFEQLFVPIIMVQAQEYTPVTAALYEPDQSHILWSKSLNNLLLNLKGETENQKEEIRDIIANDETIDPASSFMNQTNS